MVGWCSDMRAPGREQFMLMSRVWHLPGRGPHCASRAAPANAAPLDLNDPELYINRELSWLDFNQRVLDQALDDTHPLLERVKFLAIVSSNLDEFFMVRVASLLRKQRAGAIDRTSIDGMTVPALLAAIRQRAAGMLKDSTACWNDAAPAGPGRRGRPLSRSGRLHRRDPPVPGRVLPFRDLSAADAAGLRSRPSVPVHLASQQELRGGGASAAAHGASRASRSRRALPRFVPIPSSEAGRQARPVPVRVSRGRDPRQPRSSCFRTSRSSARTCSG